MSIFADKITIVRPSRGKPSIHHMAEQTDAIKAVLQELGWKDLEKLAKALRAKGFTVELRLFKRTRSDDE
jgi:hypothetical protein